MLKRMFFVAMHVLMGASLLYAQPAQLWKTGQTICYDAYGNVIDCGGTGQDGNIQAGVTWPAQRFAITYCDIKGPCEDQSSDCYSSDSTDIVADNLTGLVWASNGNLPDGTRT